MTIYKRDGGPVDDPALAVPAIGELRYNDFPLTQAIIDIVTGADFERSMEEPSSLVLTVHDPERLLQDAGALEEAANLDVGDQAYRLVGVAKAGDTFTLTFEDRDVSKLRRNTKPKKANRAKVTRSQFVKSCVDETPGIGFFDPELNRTQPIAAPDDGEQVGQSTTVSKRPGTKKKAGEDARKPGFAPGVRLMGNVDDKGNVSGPLTSAQLANAAVVLAVCAQENAGLKATLAVVEACLVEAPNFNNPTDGDSSSVGILQLLNIHFGGSVEKRRDIPTVVRAFLRQGFTGKGGAIKLAQGNLSAGQVAQAVQGSAHPGRYDRQKNNALKIIAAYSGASLDGLGSDEGLSVTTTTVTAKKYEFTRGTDQGAESTWDCAKRLAEEVQRRCFIVDHELVFTFDRNLLRQKPAATIRELEGGVDYIDYEFVVGQRMERATLNCRAAGWAGRPGDVVVVEDNGRADGRWLVSRISGSLFSVDRSVELTRPLKALKEPAPETTTSTTTASTSDVAAAATGVVTAATKGTAAAVRAAAKAISDMQIGYGPGGHGAGWDAANAIRTKPPGLDCSSSTSLALHNAGLMNSVPGPQVSDWFLRWGEPGRGEQFTVWVKPGTGNAGHVYIRFADGYEFNTAGHPSISGPRLLKQTYPQAGCVPRHWPGL